MTRPFIFRIHAAEFFAIVQNLTKKEKGEFLSSFATDLVTLNPSLDYSKKIIQEAIDFAIKKSAAGAKGGRPKKSKGLAKVKQRLSTAKANAKPETETELKEIRKEIYMGNVSLLPHEIETLKTKHGNKFTIKCIEKLSAYKMAKGKQYASDYGAINTWVVDEIKKTWRNDDELVF